MEKPLAPSASQLVTRIAPTPSGFLHAGNAYSFLLTACLAERLAAKIVLRIDDSDSARCRDEYLEDIFRAVEALKIPIGEGPASVDEFKKKFSQERLRQKAVDSAQALFAQGRAFYCDCTRKNLAPGLYPGTCRERGLGAGGDRALRLRSASDFVPSARMLGLRASRESRLGDFVLLKKDSSPSYQLTSLMHDLELGTSLIVRGLDLYPSTCAQLELSAALGHENFANARFVHHDLLSAENGVKLSKSTLKHDFIPFEKRWDRGELLDKAQAFVDSIKELSKTSN